MKRSLFSVALACLAVAAAVPASADGINTGGLFNIDQTPVNLAEAYPCTATGYDAKLGITDQQVFNGFGINCAVPGNNGTPGPVVGAAPGILCLKRPAGSFALDVNCFVTIPGGQFPPCFVQAYRLYKMVPGSFKCPDVYGLPHFKKDSSGNLVIDFYTYVQFGTGIRTWWALNFTQPGTRFLLQVVSVCRTAQPVNGLPAGATAIHVDSWRWRVVADENTLLNLINLMHSGAVSTLEVPCILGEDMYDALVKAQSSLKSDIEAKDAAGNLVHNLTAIGNDLFNMEALIVANCLFVEVLNPLVVFPGPTQSFDDGTKVPGFQPPGNLAETVAFTQGSAVAGIIDTVEHPCCCKLLVDLEWISISQGIIGQTPTLPTF